MRKSEVEFHSDNWAGPSRPAVNVKVYARVDSEEAIGAARDYLGPELDPRFEGWYLERLEDDGFTEHYWEFAIEAAWEQLQSEAEYIWGAGVKVYSEGRSGGWAVVDGLEDFEQWDAIELNKWARFAKVARIYADGIPGDMAILASINSFEGFLADQAKLLTGPTFEPVG